MKRLSKFLSVSIVALFSLTSCAFVANIMGSILVNAIIDQPLLLTAVDLLPEAEEVDPTIIEWERRPTSSENRARIEYLKNVFIVPDSLTTNVLNTDVRVDFTVDAGESAGAFKTIRVTKDELPEDFNFDLSSLPVKVDFTLNVLVPIGDSDFLDGVESFADLETHLQDKTKKDFIEASNQESQDVTLSINVKSANTSKTKTFYFNLEKPNFNEKILDEVFDSRYLISIYHEKEDTIESLATLPSDASNPKVLSYFRNSIAIPKKVELIDIGEVTFEVETSNPALFFEMNMTRSIDEIDEGNELVEGDIEVYTFTPVGTYKENIPSSVTDIDGLRSHFEGIETKTLYEYIRQPKHDFTITIYATINGKTRHETFYFTLNEPEIDQEIGEAIMRDYDIVNYIDHSDLTKSVDNPVQPSDENNPYVLNYFKESLVFPQTFEFSDFPDKVITFDINFHGAAEFFYRGIKEHTYEGRPVTGQTFSPIGTYDASGITTFNELVDHISLNAEAIDNHNSSEIVRDIRITVSILINDQVSATETYYFTLMPY